VPASRERGRRLAAARRGGLYIYWADPANHSIDRADVNGRNVAVGFIKPVDYACGVTIHGNYIYWANLWNAQGDGPGKTIGRARLDGTDVDNEFVTGAAWPCGVAVAGGHIYWADTVGQNPGQAQMPGLIGQAKLSGSQVAPHFLNVNGLPDAGSQGFDVSFTGLAVAGTELYWADAGNATIGRAGLDGSAATNALIQLPGATNLGALAVTARYVYWATGLGVIGRAALDGTGVAARLIHLPFGGVCSMAVHGGSIYFTWAGAAGQVGGVGRVNVNGRDVSEQLGSTSKPGAGNGCGIAVGPGA